MRGNQLHSQDLAEITRYCSPKTRQRPFIALEFQTDLPTVPPTKAVRKTIA